jgi:hypothetical protein
MEDAMTEEQAEQMMELLKQILRELEEIHMSIDKN